MHGNMYWRLHMPQLAQRRSEPLSRRHAIHLLQTAGNSYGCHHHMHAGVNPAQATPCMCYELQETHMAATTTCTLVCSRVTAHTMV